MSSMVAMQGQMTVWGGREQLNGKELDVYLLCLGCIESADGFLEFRTGMPLGYT